jgi:hypothetical protein
LNALWKLAKPLFKEAAATLESGALPAIVTAASTIVANIGQNGATAGDTSAIDTLGSTLAAQGISASKSLLTGVIGLVSAQAVSATTPAGPGAV